MRLACNAINIDSTGSQAVLARSLFDNNRLDSDQQVATSSSSSDHQSPIVVAPVQVQQNNSILAPEPEFDIRAFLRAEVQSFLSVITANFVSPVIQGPSIQQGATVSLDQIAEPQQLNPVNFLPLSTPTRGSSRLPPLTQNILMQISSGKFVNFDSLLPTTSPLTMDEYTIKVNSGADPLLSLVPKAQNRPRVIDFYTC